LGEARDKLEEVHALAKSGGFISAAAQRKFTFAHLANKHEENQGEAYLQGSKRFFVKALVDHFGDMKLSQITPLEIENFKKKRRESPTQCRAGLDPMQRSTGSFRPFVICSTGPCFGRC